MAYFDQAFIDKLNELSIETVAEKLGMKVNKHHTLCPWHDDHDPSLTFNTKTKANYCHCFTCGKGGGPITLTMAVENCTFPEACKKLANAFSISLPGQQRNYAKIRQKPQETVKEKEDDIKAADVEVLNWIIQHTGLTKEALQFLEEERKIKRSVIDNMNIRSLDNEAETVQNLIIQFGAARLLDNNIIEKGYYGYQLAWNVPCLLFPYYDITGSIVNIQSRYLRKQVDGKPPRFRFIKDVRTSVYNIDMLSRMEDGTVVLVTEGVTDCLAALSSGIAAVAVPGAGAFKAEYVEYLKDFRLFICPDNDEAGSKLLQDIKTKMEDKCCTVRVLRLEDHSKDIGEYYSKHETLRFTV